MMLRWDFRYLEAQSVRRHSGRVTQGQLTSTVRGNDRYWQTWARRRRMLLIGLGLMALALWGIWRVFG